MNNAAQMAKTQDISAAKSGLIADLIENMAEPSEFIALTGRNDLRLHTSELLKYALKNAKSRDQLDKAIAGTRAAHAHYGHAFKVRFVDHVAALRGNGDYARLIRLQETIPDALDFSGLSSVQLEQIMTELRGLDA